MGLRAVSFKVKCFFTIDEYLSAQSINVSSKWIQNFALTHQFSTFTILNNQNSLSLVSRLRVQMGFLLAEPEAIYDKYHVTVEILVFT
jgi:hypothetical protein